MKSTYITNGVILNPHEQKTIDTLLTNGHRIELIPRSMAQGIHTADIILDGKLAWEIKCPKGNSK
jgi:hypothetical protein